MFTLILGGVRSGKSRHAARLAARAGPRVYFVATARARDSEMRRRVAAHRRTRPVGWRTIEESRRVPARLARLPRGSTVVVDCVTLWVSRLLMDGASHRAIAAQAEELLRAARARRLKLIAVSNEVGSGVIPPSRLGRKYQDVLGEVNAILAKGASRVLLMIAGIPLKVK